MKKLLLAGVSLAAMGWVGGAYAADASLPAKTPTCKGVIDPYKN